MQHNSINNLSPPTGSSRYFENAGEDDFDVARFSAIRKEQKDEMERLEDQYNSSQAAIENQVRGEIDELFQQFQLGMQHLYTNLTKTVNSTIESQVQLRLKQERLRRERDAKETEINARYHNEASKLIISTSHGGRPSKPFSKFPSQGVVPSQGPIPNQGLLPSQGPPPSQSPQPSRTPVPSQGPLPHSAARSSSFTATNGGQHISPAATSLNRSQSSQQRVQPRAPHSDDLPRERVLQQAPRHESMAQLPTPLPTPGEPVHQLRKPVPSEPINSESRPIDPHPHEPRRFESRPIEPRPSELRGEPRAVRTPPVESLHVEPRPTHQRFVEQHHVEHRHVEHRTFEQRPIEQHQVEQRPVEQRPVKQRPIEQRQVEQRPSEQRPSEQRPSEQRPSEQRPVEQPPVEQPPVEQPPLENIAARHVNEEPERVEERQSAAPSSEPTANYLHQAPATTAHRDELKRKAVESSKSERATVMPSAKRPRTRDRTTENRDEMPLLRSPRSTRQSLDAAHAPQVRRTITFQEVYQHGKAQFKHKIFMWPKDSGDWYIVRCDEHQVHFNNGNPKHGAAKHVHSPQHGGLEKKHDLAMQICGHLVTDCNAELAELNNREFQRALDEDNYQVFNMNLLTKEGKRRLTDTPAKAAETPAKDAETPAKTAVINTLHSNIHERKKLQPLAKPLGGITCPEECKFYLGWWRSTKKYYMLIVLPLRQDGSLREVGLKEKLQETDLMDKVPKCYSTDRLSLQIKGWQPAYADDGPKVDKREYPVMFFDSLVQRHSVAWLSATKLKPVDLFNPPSGVDRKQLAMAREWYAVRMMHRKDWEQFQRLGPGEAPSPTSSEGEPGRSEQWPSLRSARTDEISPIRGKSSGPGHYWGSESSEDGSDTSDAEDPMTMDIGPIPEAPDSNYAEENSGSEETDVGMGGAAPAQLQESYGKDVVRPGLRSTSSQPDSRDSRVHAQQMGAAEEESQDPSSELPWKATSQTNEANKTQTYSYHQTPVAAQSTPEMPISETPTPPAANKTQREITVNGSEQDLLRSSVQAKAMAAIKEAASRSRPSSECPEASQHSPRSGQVPARPPIASRPPFLGHSPSKSENTLANAGAQTFTSEKTSKLNEAGGPAGLTNILSKEQGSAQTGRTVKSPADPYKTFAAIRAEISKSQSSRAASVPVRHGDNTAFSLSPPPPSDLGRDVPSDAIQHTSPNISQTMSPPLSQSSTMVPARSLSTTPTNGVESGRNTPKIVIPDTASTGRWKAVRTDTNATVQQSRRAPMSKNSSGHNGLSDQVTGSSIAAPVRRDTQLGTPIPDKQESFDVSQFYDSHGTSWSRVGTTEPFLRLVTDPMRKWAETARGAPLTLNIEPAHIKRIETDHPNGNRDEQRVQLVTEPGHKLVLIFETNAASGRSQGAALQGRKFVSWVKKMNESVEWVDDIGSRPGSGRESYLAEQPVTVR